MRLYEIPGAIRRAIEESVNPETGEIEDLAALDAVQLEAADKLAATALYIKEREADADELAKAIADLQSRKRSIDAETVRIKSWMLPGLQAVGKVKTPFVTVSTRRSRKTVLDVELDRLPDAFKRIKVEPDMSKIADVIKSGSPELAGIAHIEESTAVTIRTA